MKTLATIFLLFNFLTFSCVNPIQVKTQSVENKTFQKNAIKDACPVSAYTGSLPCGSKYLIDIPFPEVFQFQSYSESEVVTKEDQAFADAFDKADEYYNSLNKKKVIDTIICKNVEYIKLRHKYFSNDSLRISKAKVLGVHRKFWPLDSLPHTLGNVIYKLPNFESYKCFYAYKKLFGGPTEWDDPKPVERPFLEIGNLIFNNPLNGSTKVVNIFFKADVGGFIGYERFFYIDSAKKIHIFSTTSDEEYTYFHKECTIKVLNNGEIKVSYLK